MRNKDQIIENVNQESTEGEQEMILKNALIDYLDKNDVPIEQQSILRKMLGEKDEQIVFTNEIQQILEQTIDFDDFEKFVSHDLDKKIDTKISSILNQYIHPTSKKFINAFLSWAMNKHEVYERPLSGEGTILDEMIFPLTMELNQPIESFLRADQNIYSKSKFLTDSSSDLIKRIDLFTQGFASNDLSEINKAHLQESDTHGIDAMFTIFSSKLESWNESYQLMARIDSLEPKKIEEILQILKVDSLDKLIQDVHSGYGIRKDDVYEIITAQEEHDSDTLVCRESIVEFYRLLIAQEAIVRQQRARELSGQSWADTIKQQEKSAANMR